MGEWLGALHVDQLDFLCVGSAEAESNAAIGMYFRRDNAGGI